MAAVLELRNIRKTFPGVVALNHMNFSVEEGEVHAIVGENGAGKSTLIKVIAGVHSPDDGEVLVNGKEVAFHGPQDAINAGIGVVHQETALFPDLSIMENMFMGRLPRSSRGGVVDFAAMRQRAGEIYQRLGVSIDLNRSVKTLKIAEKQMLEIAKALSQDSRILILDEPTAALSIREVEKLFSIIRELKKDGVTIIYISHRLEEIFEIADRITVIRDGEYIASSDIAAVDRTQLVRWMVGREVTAIYPQKTSAPGDVMLQVENLSDGSLLNDVSFELHRGEILGFAGLAGAGRSETAMAVTGLRRKTSGTIRINGKRIANRRYTEALQNRMVYISEDRQRYGLTLTLSIKDNITLSTLRSLCHFGVIDRKKDQAMADSFMKTFSIAAPHRNFVVGNLSGGNQQKVSVSKGLACRPEVLILDEPTRGVDVGAKSEIHEMIKDLAEEGMGIILISSEMPEVLGMSDRICVFRDGSIVGSFLRHEATQENVLALALDRNQGKENSIENNR